MAIPTKYAGVQFRSRLEARWAAFFDLAGWRWTYEPVDFDGWIPDFVLHGFCPIYVEVKPIMWPEDINAQTHLCETREDLKKIRSPDVEVLVLGVHLPNGGEIFNTQSIGALYDPCCGPWPPDGTHGGFDPAFLYGGTLVNGVPQPRFDFASAFGVYTYRMSGDYDGNGHLISLGDGPNNPGEQAWRQAGNIVQWRAPRQA